MDQFYNKIFGSCVFRINDQQNPEVYINGAKMEIVTLSYGYSVPTEVVESGWTILHVTGFLPGEKIPRSYVVEFKDSYGNTIPTMSPLIKEKETILRELSTMEREVWEDTVKFALKDFTNDKFGLASLDQIKEELINE